MTNITTTYGLKSAIQVLEAELELNKKGLRDQFSATYDAFRPVNLLKDTLKKVASPPFLIENILGPALGLAAGYFLKKK